MPNKKILLLTIFLIGLLAVSAVSAADENATAQTTATNIDSADDSNGTMSPLQSDDSKSQTGLEDSPISVSLSSTELVKNERLDIVYYISSGLKTAQNVSCFIDNEFQENLQFDEYSLSGDYYLDVEKYSPGNHTCTLSYSGDGYYKPFTKTFQFEIVNVSFVFKEKMYEDDIKNVYVVLPSDADGTVTIEVGRFKKRFDVAGIEEDYYRSCKQIAYNVNDLEYGTYNLEMTYRGNYGNVTKKSNVTVDYSFHIYKPSYSSTDLLEFTSTSGKIFFILGIDVRGTVTAFIDGKDVRYDISKLTPGTASRSPNYFDGMIFDLAPVYFTNLQLGNHTIEIRYSGDDKYPAKSINETFWVHQAPDFDCDYWGDCYIGSEIPVTIDLPDGNAGNFSLYVSDDAGKNYTLVKSVEIKNGKAKITYECAQLGEYILKAVYDTNNDHYEECKTIDVSGIQFPKSNDYCYYLNRDYTFKARLPDDATGNFSVYVSKDWGKFNLVKSVRIVNGQATVKFKTSKEASYEFMVISDSNYGLENKSEIYYFEDGRKIVQTSGSMFYSYNGKYSIKVYGSDGKPVGKNTVVTVKIASKTIKVKTDKNGIATISIKLKPGTYKMTAKYNKVQAYEYLIVKHVVKLNALTVKKSAKKLTLQATFKNKNPLKGKTVIFKFNGKTYKAKTNSKGIAKVTVPKSVLSKLKVGKKVTYQATYGKDTVKKTVKVLK